MVSNHSPAESRRGLIYGLMAYGWWGLMPLYFWALKGKVSAEEIVAVRIVACCIFLVLLVLATKQWPALMAICRNRRLMNLLILSTFLIAFNWYVYIYAINTEQAVETSLGYFINPLLNVLLGAMIFGERPRKWQLIAVAVAGAGVANMVFASGQFPWIAAVLALSFGLYGVVRKIAHVSGLLGLTVESAILLVPCSAYVIWLHSTVGTSFGQQGPLVDWLLALSGVITAVPMICFGAAARLLNLSTLGFIQFLSPSFQFLLAVTVMGETVKPGQPLGFALIWVALAIYTAESFGFFATNKKAAEIEAELEETSLPSS